MPRKRSGKHARLFAGGVPEPVVARVDIAPEDETAAGHQGRGNESKDGQLDVDAEHHQAHADHHQKLKEKAASELHDEAVEGLGVVGDAADERADLLAVVVSD